MTACLTGYTLADLARLERSSVTCAHFFQRAPAMNPDRALITDKVCGVRVWDLLIRDIRYLGKLVDELPKGPLWSRFSGKTSMSRSFWPFRNSGLFSPREPFALPPRRGSVFRCTGCFGHCKSRRARCAASPPPGAPGQSPRRPGRPARNPVCSTGGHPPCRCCPGPGRSSDCSIPRAPGPGAWIVWQWLRTALH